MVLAEELAGLARTSSHKDAASAALIHPAFRALKEGKLYVTHHDGLKATHRT